MYLLMAVAPGGRPLLARSNSRALATRYRRSSVGGMEAGSVGCGCCTTAAPVQAAHPRDPRRLRGQFVTELQQWMAAQGATAPYWILPAEYGFRPCLRSGAGTAAVTVVRSASTLEEA